MSTTGVLVKASLVGVLDLPPNMSHYLSSIDAMTRVYEGYLVSGMPGEGYPRTGLSFGLMVHLWTINKRW
jgi:hypothetical protein